MFVSPKRKQGQVVPQRPTWQSLYFGLDRRVCPGPMMAPFGQSRPKCKAKQPNYELRGRFVCLSSVCVCVCVCVRSSTLFDYLQHSSAWIIIAPNCLDKQQTLGRSSCSTTSLLSTQQSTTGQYSVPHKFSSLSPSISKIHFYIVPHFTLKYVFRVKVINN